MEAPIDENEILGNSMHSNDSHQCPILAADFVIFYYGTENEEAIQAGAGSEWGIEVGYSFSIPKQVSCQYGTLMWIIAVVCTYALDKYYYTLLWRLHDHYNVTISWAHFLKKKILLTKSLIFSKYLLKFTTLSAFRQKYIKVNKFVILTT